MKYRFLSILSIPLLFITSCMDNTKETTSSNITNNEQTNIESENYNFSDFIKIFTTDSVFQINHIKFPLEEVSIEWDEENNDSTSISYIKKSEWKYYGFPDTIYDGIKLEHPIDTTNFTYTELGVDTGVSTHERPQWTWRKDGRRVDFIGLATGSHIYVYNTQGMCVSHTVAGADMTNLQLTNSGVYLVKVDHQVIKLKIE